MKISRILVSVMLLLTLFVSCNDFETYAEQKDRERDGITKFIADSAFQIISESQFATQNYKTIGDKQFVLFDRTGVYMQILEEGCGERIKNQERLQILCRFTEFNILTDSIQLRNDMLYYSYAGTLYTTVPEKMNVYNNNGTYTASFEQAGSMMVGAYGTASVPSGWLVPLPYINIGREEENPDGTPQYMARVRLIVPHSQGQSYASRNVYPCFYNITYQRGL